MMFYVKLAIHSIHSCIHHHLYPNTARDTDRMVSRLLHAGSILLPTKDRSPTPRRYSHSMCKHEFNVKLAICSIHLCIHHHLDRITEKDMDWMVCRLLHALLVAYQLIMSSLPTIFIQPMQTCIQHEAVGLLYPFVHSVSPVFKYKQRYGSNSLQATTRAHCSTPTNGDRHTQQYS